MWVDQMVDHFSTYIYQKRGFYYFSKRIPKQLQHCHGKQRIVFALNTRSRAKAVKYAQVICQRLDERWLPMRLDAMGLGNVLANDVMVSSAPKLSEALEDYLQLKGMGSDDPLPVDIENLQPSHFIGDVVTRPAVTPLVQYASDLGCRVMNGVDMFEAQGNLLIDIISGACGR